jgi:formylglycine-generating enzyme required for sulfatase activity
MKRKWIIMVVLAAVLVAVAGIAVWRLLSPAPGLSAPIEMVELLPGEFLMGSPEDEEDNYLANATLPQGLELERISPPPQCQVRITYAFKMGKTEVTQKQWHEVMGTTIQQQRDKAQEQSSLWRSSLGDRLKELGEAIKDNSFGAFERIKDNGVWTTLKELAVGEERWSLDGEGDDHPMYYVNWEEATEFCRRLTDLERAAGRLPVGHVYRLPTEAEWEYACRAGSTTQFAEGDSEIDLDKVGWYYRNSGGTSHRVGTKLPNAWGLHDMHGSISEWCHDWYADYPAGEVVNPFGPATGSDRIIRGGHWNSDAWNCRSAYRSNVRMPLITSSEIGFRIVLSPVLSRE